MKLQLDRNMIFLLILIPMIHHIHGQVGCPMNSTFFNGYCYYLEAGYTRYWDDAQTICREKYRGELTSITSQEENDFIFDLIQPNYLRAWIGLHDDNNGSNWHWTDGSNYDTYQNWMPGEPNNQWAPRDFNYHYSEHIDEHCGEMVNHEDWYPRNQWNNKACNSHNHFICKFTIFKIFYEIPLHSDYEVKFNFSANPRPSALEWSYEANFQQMPNIIQIPSDNGKFSTSLIDLENGTYQTLLRIADITKEDYETKFKLHVANENGETDYRIMLSGCGGEYNSDSGVIRHPFNGGNYQDGDNCTWIIRAAVRIINITFVSFDTEECCDYLLIRNGESIESAKLRKFSGDTVPSPFLTVPHQRTEAEAHLVFTSDSSYTRTGFELHWEPAVKTFENIPINGDYEVRLDFSAIPQPTSLKWLYGANFQEMHNFIQIPSDNGKFSASLIVLENGKYQALLKISGITVEDVETKFKLHVQNENGHTDYKVMLSGCGGEYNSSSGTIRHPKNGGKYQNDENCIWIIRVATGVINITFVSFDTEERDDYLTIRDGDSIASYIVGWLSGDNVPKPFLTSTNGLHLLFTSDSYRYSTGFELHWEAADAPIQTNHVPMHSDYEVRIDFSATPQPTVLKWSYGPNFQEMLNLIQIPSDNGKFSTSLIDIENGKYQALLRIAGITEEDIETKFMLHVANNVGKADYRVNLYGCGGEYNSSSGIIRHPWNGGRYQNNDNCTWIIRAADRINFTLINFDTESDHDYLTIRDGESLGSNVLYMFSGHNVPRSFQTSTNAAHLLFTSDDSDYNGTGTGFELHWEPAVKIFYQIPLHNDYKVRFNFSANPQPTALEWSYGTNFQEMPNLIQIPSDNEKFSTSLIDLENNKYQAILRIATTTEEDFKTKFKLHVADEIGETEYKVILTAFPHPPSNLQFSNIVGNSVQIMWNYNDHPGDLTYYVIKYKPKYGNHDYTEISTGLHINVYTINGLMPYTEYEFRVFAVNSIGCGPPSEPSFVTTGCGGGYNSSSGVLLHPFNGGNYQDYEHCTWIIRAGVGIINITIVRIDIHCCTDYLYIRDGDSIESNMLHKFTGDNVTRSFQTSTNRAHLLFTSGCCSGGTGFELHWEPTVTPIQIFYQIPMDSDYEVRLNFTANPQPTALKWYYGPNFQEMSSFIQIPSDNGKFSTSLIDLENGNYQCLLRIAEITEEDYEIKFNLHVANEMAEANYRVVLSEFPPRPSVHFINITKTSVQMTWDYINPGDITYYVIQYKPRKADQDYTEISGIDTTFYTVRGLTISTEYEFLVRAMHKIGHGPPSEASYVYTSCGGEYNSDSGTIRHPLSGDRYQGNENCTWIIRAAGAINITFSSFNTVWQRDYLYIRNSESIESERIYFKRVSGGYNLPKPIQTGTNTAHLHFSPNGNYTGTGFVLHWEPAVKFFYPVPLHSDYEVRLNISANTRPTTIHWCYGPNFQDMPNKIQIPSDNGKFSTFLIDLKNDKYQAVLRLAGITEEDFNNVFKLHVANEIGETDYRVIISGCGGEYNTSSGTIRHPLSGDTYQNNDNCTWIIRVAIGTIKITFDSFDVEHSGDSLTIRDGDSIDSDVLKKLYGRSAYTVQTTSNAAHLHFKSDIMKRQWKAAGFKLHWEQADTAITTLKVPVHSDCEVRINFFATPRPTVLEWYYGNNFQEMPNLIQSPSDNGKFSTSLIDLQNGEYQARLGIAGITEEEIERKYKLQVANELGEANYRFILYACGNEYNSSRGTIRHPRNGVRYMNNDKCTWIIRAAGPINITFVSFSTEEGDTEERSDYLYIRDGDSIESNLIRRFFGDLVPSSVQTTTNAAHMLFTSDKSSTRLGFELHWEPAVAPIQTFYQIPLYSNYEVRLNFSDNPQPTALKWTYGPNFQEMPNVIQIPSDNGKFSTSLIGLENGKYQALLRITGTTEEDFETKFKLHVGNETDQAIYRVMLSMDEKPFGCPEGFFMSKGSTQCFKIFLDAMRSWEEAKAKCEEEGLITPTLYDAVAPPLRKYLLYTHGDGSNVWLDALANGFKWVWQRDGAVLRIDSPLWWLTYPGSTRLGNCLSLMVDDSSLRRHPDRPYTPWDCDTRSYTLCQVPTPILFNFHELIVNPNEKFQLECGTTGNYSYCVWEKETDILQVQDVYENVYSGMGRPENTEGNQCGIVVDQATNEDDGIWTCKMYIQGTELVRSRKVILTVKPTQAEVSPHLINVEGYAQHEVVCSVMAARPAVKITWALNGSDISSKAQVEERPSKPNGTYMTLSTLSHYFLPEHNGQKLECVVEHHSLAKPEIINVPFTLVFIGGFQRDYFESCMHSDYELRVNYSANPRPTTLEWYYGDNFQEMHNLIQIPSNNGKFSTSLMDLDNDNYQVLLKIAGVTEEDFETKFKLHVGNEFGEDDYRVIPYFDEKPSCEI